MGEHPIEGLMTTAMNSIKDMVDVNTIIGKPIETTNNIVIIPISKVTFGFAAGGSEFTNETITEHNKKEKEENIKYHLPFGGGSGAGVTINPVSFIVIDGTSVKIMPVTHTSSVDKLLDYVPDLMEKVDEMMNKYFSTKSDKVNNILSKINTNDKSKIVTKTKKEEDLENNVVKTKKTVTQKDSSEKTEPREVEYEYKYEDKYYEDE